MPKLVSCLQGQDLGFLRIVASLWGFDLTESDARSARTRLVTLLLDRQKFQEHLCNLPPAARKAVDELFENGGQVSWPAFTRKYGELREMGPGKRDREKPYASSQATVCETLYYRAILARRFQDATEGPAEFAILPDEWLEYLSPAGEKKHPIFGRPASPAERGRFILASDSLLEDACTLLAGLRSGIVTEQLQSELVCGKDTPYPLQAMMLEILLREAGLIDHQRNLNSETVREFFEAPSAEVQAWLARTWKDSTGFNEMRLLPGLVLEGEWRNDPRRTRALVLDFLNRIPGGKDTLGVAGKPWWSLKAFITAVHTHHPDIQRQAGEYDAWYLADPSSREPLSGFQHWNRVEGRLLDFIIGGPLHWLGILDLSLSTTQGSDLPAELTAFRLSAGSASLLEGKAPQMKSKAENKLTIRSNGSIHAPSGTPRAARYQVARFCEWDGQKDGVYRYRLTAAGLEKANQQGLKVEHILGILARHSQAVPPALVQALKRWEANGSQVRLEQLSVLRLKDPELLKVLRSSPASRYLGEPLSANAVVVKPGAWQKVVNALVELGYVVEEKSPLNRSPE